MKKKFLLFLLATVAGAGTLFAESGKCGENLTWNLTGGVLTISGTGEMYDFENGSLTPWYDISSTINTVIINEGVTYIGASAFEHYENIQAINIPYSITSIGDGAFNWCESLTQVTLNSDAIVSTDYTQYSISNIFGYQVEEYIIGNRVTSIGHRAFYNYDGIHYGKENNLTSVTIGNSVTSIGSEAFYGCSNLVSASLPEGVTSIGDEAFKGCSSLSSINIPESVTSIEQMAFCACSSLTSITIPEGVSIISLAVFMNCSSLTSINIPKSATVIDSQAFSYCNSLTSINIPNSVTTIGSGAFEECESLTSVVLGSGITDLEEGVFYDSKENLTSVTCYAINPPTIHEWFGDNTIIYVPAESVSAYKSAEYWKMNRTILPIGTTPETDDIRITPSDNSAVIVWKAIANAASYELAIESSENTWRFVFDAEGELTSSVYHAPAHNDALQGMQSENFSYTITGLTSGTTYNVTITAKAANGSTLNTETASFTTTGEQQRIEDVNVNNTERKKILRNGQILILRGDKTYTLQGQEVK